MLELRRGHHVGHDFFFTLHTVMLYTVPSFYILIFGLSAHVGVLYRVSSLCVTSDTLTVPVDLWVHVVVEMMGR